MEVSDIISLDDAVSDDELLSLAASAESKSEHPLGKAVVLYAKERVSEIEEPNEFKMATGKGVYANVSGKAIYCGNEKFLAENGVDLNESVHTELQRLRSQGKALILVAMNMKCIGVIALSDVLRSEAKDIVSKLSSMKTKTVLLTGDNRKTAEYFAKQVDITEVYSELLPAEKVASIEKFQTESRIVCMIGDGVNDAPALKTASVGVAMGGMGSDIAVEAADIALMSDDISRLPYLKRLSNATIKTIKASITLSMCINFVAVTLSVLGMLNPTTGALVHNAGSCFVVLIAALLYDRKFE